MFHSNYEYASIDSIDELRRERRRLRMRIARAEQNMELRTRQLLTLDSIVSSLAPRIMLVKQSVSSFIESYVSLREFIRSIRSKTAENKSETAPDCAKSEEIQTVR